MFVLLSRSQAEAGPGRTVKQEQEEISRNHIQTFSGGPCTCPSNTDLTSKKTTSKNMVNSQLSHLKDRHTGKEQTRSPTGGRNTNVTRAIAAAVAVAS